MRSYAGSVNFSIVLMWCLLVVAALINRPLLPVDETRYLAVAWDMWTEGHYLVPHLNGEPYSHKPPLLFWLMTAGWHLFGVNEWWPRLVAPVFGLGTVLLTGRLAQVLWPDRKQVSATAPLILLGTLFWTVFTTLTMFDMMFAFFNLAAIVILTQVARTGSKAGFFVAGLMLGLGVLAKGPAILIHYLPVALSAPWWLKQLPISNNVQIWSWKRWYFGVACSVLCAAGVGLAWAVPAGIMGGEAYRESIFWGQSAGRVVNSFAHARPFWWYAAVLPVLVMPWLIWPPTWRHEKRPVERLDGAQRLCIIWFASAFLVFSLVNGKQAHYLLPEFPALALLVSSKISNKAGERRIDTLFPGSLLVFFAILVLLAENLPFKSRVIETIAEADIYWGYLILVSGIAVIIFRAKPLGICFANTFSIIAVYLAAAPVLAARYDLAPIANEIRRHQEAGRAVANFGKYHGQYHFLGRLIKPINIIGQVNGDELGFLSANPEGVIVAYYENLPLNSKPIFTHTYRRLTVAIWPAQTLIENPGIANRQ